MFRLLPFRCLPAIILCAAFPAATQAQPDSIAAPSTTENSAISETGDIPVADQVPKASPELTPGELGEIHMVRQRYAAAIREYSKIEHPSARDLNQMGIAYQQMFALKEAERCYKESLKIDPLNPKVLNNLGTVQDEKQDFEAAEKTYRKSLKINPNAAITLKNLGTNLLMQHEYEKGQELYKQALALDPHVFDDHLGPKVNDPAPRQEHGTAAYFKARSCALAGLNDCAITYLGKAFNEGAATVKKVTEDSDFSNLQGTPALTRLLARQQ